MRRGDILWLAALTAIAMFLIVPSTHNLFLSATKAHPYAMGFAKVALLATLGELLALRIVGGEWRSPVGLHLRAFVWGLLGISFVLVFDVFASGVNAAIAKGLLPVGGFAKVATAFWISALMNVVFAPTMMAFHRVTDTYLDLAHGKLSALARVTLREVAATIDWQRFIGFVILQTIPLFWIPAHTVTFLLPPEYRVLMAALLSIALGAILAFAKRRSEPAGARVQASGAR